MALDSWDKMFVFLIFFKIRWFFLNCTEAVSRREVLCKLNNFAKFTGKCLCQSLAQVFFCCESLEIFKITFFIEHSLGLLFIVARLLMLLWASFLLVLLNYRTTEFLNLWLSLWRAKKWKNTTTTAKTDKNIIKKSIMDICIGYIKIQVPLR